MVSTMKIVDTKIVNTKSAVSFRVRVNRTGRRTYSPEYKLEIVAACSTPGASVAAVAMSHRINANLVRRWIVQHRSGRLGRGHGVMPTLLPVTLSAARAQASLEGADCTSRVEPKHASAPGVIEIELESARVRVRGAVDGAALRVVLDALVQL
jgi:transposase